MLGAVLAVVALAGIIAAVVVAVRLTHKDEVLPGTRMAGLSLGGDTEAEARRRLQAVEDADTPLALTTGTRVVRLAPSEAGYDLDAEASAERAMRSGREGIFGGAWPTIKGLFTPRDVPVVATIDRRALREAVAKVAARLDRPASVGTLEIDPDTLTVTATAPRRGREVDQRRLRSLVRSALRTDANRPVIRVPIERTPVASRARIQELAADAEAYLRRPLRLTGGGAEVELSPRQLARLIELQPIDEGRDAQLGAKPARARAVAARIAEEVDREPRSARLSAPLAPVTFDDKGDTSWRPRPAQVTVRPARNGREVDEDGLASSIDEAIRTGRHTASLEVERIKPEITTAAARRADSLIGTFTTHYQPGQPRVRNIRRIASAVDGTIIPPGGQFSLNAISGPRTREKGYVPAPFIAEGNRLVDSVGGGVSQFSTTMYNAAYFAGLQIDEHQPHSLFIDRYPAGREATLNYGSIDMKWTNDTDAPVLVRSAGDADSVTVSLYGDNGGRRVRANTTSRESVPGADFTIVVERVVRYPDGRVARQPYTTRYELPTE